MSILSDIASGLAKGAANISGAAVTGALGSTLGGIVNTSAGVVATGAKESGKQTAPTGDPTKDTVNAVRDLQSDFNSQSGIQQQTLGTLQNHSALFGYMLKQSALTNKYLEKLLAKNFTNVNVNAPFGLGGLGGIGSLVRPLLGAGAGALVGGAGGELFGRGVNDLLKPLKRMFGYTADRFPNMARWGEQHSIHGYKSGLPEGVGKSPDIMSMLGLSAKADDLSPAMSDLQRRQEQQKRDAQIQSISELTYEAREIKFKADKITFEMTGTYTVPTGFGAGGGSGSASPGGGTGGGAGGGGTGAGGGATTPGGEGPPPDMGGSTSSFKGGKGSVSPEQFKSFLKAHGATENQATMLTAAGMAESHLNPTLSHDGGTGYGLFGHNLGRLNMRGKGWQEQALLALNELKTGSDAGAARANRILAEADPNDAQAIAIAQMHYERPQHYHKETPWTGHNWSGRLSYTKQVIGMHRGEAGPYLDETRSGVTTKPEESKPEKPGKQKGLTGLRAGRGDGSRVKKKNDKTSGLTEEERFHQERMARLRDPNQYADSGMTMNDASPARYRDPSQQYAASGHIMNDASPVRKRKHHRAEGIGEIDYTKLRPLDVDTGSGFYRQVKDTLENYIGAPLTDQHVANMIRIGTAESAAKLKDPREAAITVGSAINRGIYRYGAGGEGFNKAIMARQQYQSVTGKGSGFHPAEAFRAPTKSRVQQIMEAIVDHLPYVPHDVQYFTSADPSAYAAGAKNKFYRQMRALKGSKVIGGTISQKGLSEEKITEIPESISDAFNNRKIKRKGVEPTGLVLDKANTGLNLENPTPETDRILQEDAGASSAKWLKDRGINIEGQRAKEQSEKIEERKWLPPKEIQQQPMHDSRVERTSSPVAMNEVPERATYHKLSDLFGEVPHLNKQMSVG